jgi:hypothetical protein
LRRFLWFSLKIGGYGFFVEPQNKGVGWFPDLGLKISNYGLMIWTSKSPQQFLGLALKTK